MERDPKPRHSFNLLAPLWNYLEQRWQVEEPDRQLVNYIWGDPATYANLPVYHGGVLKLQENVDLDRQTREAGRACLPVRYDYRIGPNSYLDKHWVHYSAYHPLHLGLVPLAMQRYFLIAQNEGKVIFSAIDPDAPESETLTKSLSMIQAQPELVRPDESISGLLKISLVDRRANRIPENHQDFYVAGIRLNYPNLPVATVFFNETFVRLDGRAIRRQNAPPLRLRLA